MKKSFLQKIGALCILLILAAGHSGCTILSSGDSSQPGISPAGTSLLLQKITEPIGQSNGESVTIPPEASKATPDGSQITLSSPSPESSPLLTSTPVTTTAATSIPTTPPSSPAAVSTPASTPAPAPKSTVTTSATAVPTVVPTAVPTAASTPVPTACPTPVPTPAPTTASDDYQVENGKASYMFQLVNEARAAEGLTAYTWDSSLVPPAMKHCRDMAENDFFSHVSPTWGDFSTRFTASGISTSAAAENLAYVTIYDGATSYAHNLLMDSSGHRANILSTTYTRIGIAVIYDSIDGHCYFVQWFAK